MELYESRFTEAEEVSEKELEFKKELILYLNDKIKIPFEDVINSKWLGSSSKDKDIVKNYDNLVSIILNLRDEYKKLTGKKINI